MAKKTVYSVTTPHGVFTRTTARTYTHVAIARNKDTDGTVRAGKWGVIGWAGRLDLAVANVATWARRDVFAAFEIYAVDGSRVTAADYLRDPKRIADALTVPAPRPCRARTDGGPCSRFANRRGAPCEFCGGSLPVDGGAL